MKTLLLILLALTLTAVSCGDKDKGSSSNSGQFTDQLSVKEGYINVSNQQAPIEVGGTAYPVPNQQVMMMINQAIQMSGLQPQYINGAQKFRARITGRIYNPYNAYNGGMTYPGQMPAQNILEITSIQVY